MKGLDIFTVTESSLLFRFLDNQGPLPWQVSRLPQQETRSMLQL